MPLSTTAPIILYAPVIEWLAYHGVRVVTCMEQDQAAGGERANAARNRLPPSLVVDLVVDALEQAGRIDHLLLVTADDSFRRLVEKLQQQGVRVTLISTTARGIVSDRLRRQVDEYLDLMTLADSVKRIRRPQLNGPTFDRACQTISSERSLT
jgi:uncharacterized LabA/DUF88 family protein